MKLIYKRVEKIITILIVLGFSTNIIYSQNYSEPQNIVKNNTLNDTTQILKCNIKFGVGYISNKNADFIIALFENEFNLQLNKYFSFSLVLNYGRKSSLNVSIFQSSANIIVSPVKLRRNIFNIGGGITYYSYNKFVKRKFFSLFGYPRNGYEKYSITTTGINLFLEYFYSLNTKLTLGMKIYLQAFNSGDIATGVLFKTGLKI